MEFREVLSLIFILHSRCLLKCFNQIDGRLYFDLQFHESRVVFVQIPKRIYTLDELKLNGIEASSLLSPLDATLGSIERNIQAAAALVGVCAWNVFHITPQQLFYLSVGFLFLWTLDSVTKLSYIF